jgi:hypothetical protein
MVHDDVKTKYTPIKGISRFNVSGFDVGNDPLDLHHSHSEAGCAA